MAPVDLDMDTVHYLCVCTANHTRARQLKMRLPAQFVRHFAERYQYCRAFMQCFSHPVENLSVQMKIF